MKYHQKYFRHKFRFRRVATAQIWRAKVFFGCAKLSEKTRAVFHPVCHYFNSLSEKTTGWPVIFSRVALNHKIITKYVQVLGYDLVPLNHNTILNYIVCK